MKTIIFALSYVLALAAADTCSCTKDLKPICGSNNITYSNLCLLECSQKKDYTLHMVYAGECGSPLIVKSADSTSECDEEEKPVCGSNGITYENPCLLKHFQEDDEELQFVYPGNCGEPTFDCGCTLEYSPVCGTNGYGYPNPCLFRCATADFEDVTLAHYGACGEPVEPFTCDCPLLYHPVCGSDEVTYENHCRFACAVRLNPSLTFVDYGHC